MGQLILALVTIGVTIYAFIDCLRSEESEIQGMPKPLWLAVIVLLPMVGGILWILLGGRNEPGGHAIGRTPRVVAPDDDPDFLRSLKPPGGEDPEAPKPESKKTEKRTGDSKHRDGTQRDRADEDEKP